MKPIDLKDTKRIKKVEKFKVLVPKILREHDAETARRYEVGEEITMSGLDKIEAVVRKIVAPLDEFDELNKERIAKEEKLKKSVAHLQNKKK